MPKNWQVTYKLLVCEIWPTCHLFDMPALGDSRGCAIVYNKKYTEKLSKVSSGAVSSLAKCFI